MSRNLPELPEFQQLSDRVWRVMGLNPSNFCLQGTNTYLVGLGPRKLLIDCGEGEPDYLPLLQRSLKSLAPDAYISDILLTHCHHDHWKGLPDIMASSLNDPVLPIRVHKYPLDKSSEDHHFHMEFFPENVELQDLRDHQVFHLDNDMDLDEDDDEGNSCRTTTVHVVFTPGHASDHCCFWLEEENVMFTGDCILGHGFVVFTELSDYMQSLHVLEKLAPAKLFPGHGAVVDDALPRVRQHIQHHQQRESQILEIIQHQRPAHGGAWTAIDIAFTLYGEDMPTSMQPVVVRGIALYLIKLQKDGLARMLDGSAFDSGKLYEMMYKEWSYVDRSRL
ncbi:beta-lactamase-like protein [Gongronella butleri]|nr:beta-lactamase-like protein [Gongronella butleri]